jgi:hypothetical protein
LFDGEGEERRGDEKEVPTIALGSSELGIFVATVRSQLIAVILNTFPSKTSLRQVSNFE